MYVSLWLTTSNGMDENKPQNNIDPNIKTIHTYTSDMADAIRENETSVIKIALAEKDKREREEVYKEAEGTGTSKFFLFLGGIILIGGAIIGSYFFLRKSQSTVSTLPQIKSAETVISYDDKVYIDMTDKKSQSDLRDSIKTDVEKSGKPGTIKSIFLTQKVGDIDEALSLNDFMSLMKTEVPSPLVRTLDERYMLGTYSAVDGAHLFLIFKIKDYNQAYAAMLEWEKTLLSDMFVLFNIDIGDDKNTLFEKPWRDVIINNKDARILYRRDGSNILYYIFPDKNTFIITDSQDVIKEISTRLLSKITKPL